MSTYIRPQQKNLRDYTDCPIILRDYLRHIVTIDGLGIRTANAYYINLRLFLRYIKMLRDEIDPEKYDIILINDISSEDLAKVTEDDVLNYLYFLAQKGDGVSTRSAKLSAIKAFYKYTCAMYPSEFHSNPSLRIKSPKIPERQPKYLTEEEALLLLGAAKRTYDPIRNYCITALLLNCGMRLSELTAINVNSRVGNTIKIIGKGNKERTLYLNDMCMEAIDKWLVERAKIKDILDETAMFVSRQSHRRMTGRSIQNVIELELKLAGLSGMGFSPHKLRHTAATLMYNSGADLMELKEILGHENTVTTEIYTHVYQQRLKEVSDNNPLNKRKYNSIED